METRPTPIIETAIAGCPVFLILACVSVVCDTAGGSRGFEMTTSRYRQAAESGCLQPPPPSSQAEVYGPIPKTHRVMTLADHISVGLCERHMWSSL